MPVTTQTQRRIITIRELRDMVRQTMNDRFLQVHARTDAKTPEEWLPAGAALVRGKQTLTGTSQSWPPSAITANRQKVRRIIGNTMRAHFVVMRTMGRTRARTTEGFYGFRPADVVEMFFYKHGFGPGVWYRLKDGRFFDALGKPSRRNRAWYIPARID